MGREALAGLAAFGVLLGAYQLHLGTPSLWGDEADTGTFARMVLDRGVPGVTLGRNAILGAACEDPSGRAPWLQVYVGAASMALFGDDAAGLRRLFAFAAALAFFPLWGLLRGRVRAAPWVAMLVLLHPQTVLFARQARYYPLAILLFTAVAWLWLDLRPSRRARRIGLVAGAVLLFQTHPVVAAAAWISVLLHAAWSSKARVLEAALSGIVGLAGWVVIYVSVPDIGAPASEPSASLLARAPQLWLARTGVGLAATIADLDYVGVLPVLGWGALIALALARRRVAAVREAWIGAGGFVLLALAVHAGVVAAVIGVETMQNVAVLRYLPHLVALAPVPLVLGAEAILPRRFAALAAAALLLGVNLASLTHWWRPFERRPQPVSWAVPTFREIVRPPPDDLGAIVGALVDAVPGDGAVARVVPDLWIDVVNFYTAGELGITPGVPPASECWRRMTAHLSADEARRRIEDPDVAVVFGATGAPPGYESTLLPWRRGPPDGTRPELTRHTFHGADGGAVPVLLAHRH